MKVFILVIVATLILDIIGKVIVLYTRDFERKPWAIAIDIPIGIAMIVWAVWVLGTDM